MMQINAILSSLDDEIKNSFNEFFGSNSRVNDLNENKFKEILIFGTVAKFINRLCKQQLFLKTFFRTKNLTKIISRKLLAIF